MLVGLARGASRADRLSRSLNDFTDLSRLFEKHNVSFVSVTQQIDTSNAAGRMMLNILMPFSQFEREMTADRIRDKVYATRKKGMWSGGLAPLGYRVEDKKLVIDEQAAPVARFIFTRYAETGSVRTVVSEVEQKFGARAFGDNTHTGSTWHVAHVYRILHSVIYKGDLPFRRTGETFHGVHEPLVSEKLWTDCQRILGERAGRQPATHRETTAARFKKLLDTLGIGLYQIRDKIVIQNQRGHLMDMESIIHKAEDYRAFDPVLIVIDAFYRTLPEKTDENDNAAITRIYNRVDELAKKHLQMPDRSNRTNRAAENRYLAVSRNIRKQLRRCGFLCLCLRRENALSIERRKHTTDSLRSYRPPIFSGQKNDIILTVFRG